MKDVNIVECFDKMNATYDMLFAIDRPLAPVSEIKAKYRRGKAWGEVVLNPTNPIGQKIRDHIQKSRTSMMIHAVKDLQRAIAIYESLEKKLIKTPHIICISNHCIHSECCTQTMFMTTH